MKIEIQNKTPRRDVDGDVMDAHDGCLEFYDGMYYLYGTVYGDTIGYTQMNYYTCYSSPDLKNWRCHGDILPLRKPEVRFRPYVKRCPATSKYVLWYGHCPRWIGTTNWAAGDGPVVPGQFGVAVSDSPTGPFHTVHRKGPIKCNGSGDAGLFVDRDGTGYLIYSDNSGKFTISVEKLTPDFLSSTMESSEIFAEWREAPALFRRGDFYYALVGELCCFGPEGASVEVFRARHPLGPYEFRGKINHDAGGRIIIPAQQTHVARLGASERDPLIWMGDCWGSAPDGIKGHDLQYWSAPLQFDEKDDIMPLKRQDEWTIGE